MIKIVRIITVFLLITTFMIGSTINLIAAEPVRQAFEEVEATVTWNNENLLIIVEISGSTIILEPSSNVALVNDVTLELSHPIIIDNNISFIEVDDLEALLLALEGTEPIESEHGMTVEASQIMAYQFMEFAEVPDFSMAIANANTGFNWTNTMSNDTDVDTIFHLGSISKTFTAVAVMQLVEQGLLDLDIPIVEYIPQFSTLPSQNGEGNYRNITARMLLSHTAGIYIDDLGSGFITYGGHYESYMNNFLDRFANTHMLMEEGTAFQYSNTGYMILGILVASIAGHDNYFQGFNQYMLENVFEPMGLTRTSYIVTEELKQYVAQPYTMYGMPQQFQYFNALPTGGLFSTANEMTSLMTMFLNDGYYNGHQILTPESIDLMFTDQTGSGYYGLGILFMLDSSSSKSNYIMTGHTGGLIYNFAAMFIDREHGIGAFSASNSTSSQGLNEILVGSALLNAITDTNHEFIPPVSDVDPEAVAVELTIQQLNNFEGLYLIAGGVQHLFVELVEGELYLRIPDQELDIVLTPMSDGHFSTEMGIPFWLIAKDDGDVFFVQGSNRYAIIGEQVDATQFIPNENFMESLYGFTFKAYIEQDFYVFLIPTMTFGVTEDGFAYSSTEIINLPPSITSMIMLESMENNRQLNYENGEYFFYDRGVRFVRQ